VVWQPECLIKAETLNWMLRITLAESENEVKWILDGQLAGPFVAELKSSWLAASGVHKSVIDLTNVTFIDESGARVLCAMGNAGVKFISRGVDTNQLLEDLKRKSAPSLRRCLSWLTSAHDEADK
jgi:anti-anti-sigma regulatory factor